jgi:hypothetical protein
MENTKKNLFFYRTPSSFVLSSPAKLKAGKLRVFVIVLVIEFSVALATSNMRLATCN